MISYLVIGAIVFSIAFGYKFKINVGILGMAFAYIIGCFVLGLSTKKVIAMWPTSLFFMLFTITFFYGFALANGTLVKLTEKGVYISRKCPYLIPVVLYVIAFSMAGVGAGPYAVFTFLAPPIMMVANRTNMSKVLAAIIIVGAGVAGGYTPISTSYATIGSILETVGYETAELEQIVPKVCWNNILSQFIVFALGYIILKGYKTEAPADMEKPESFDGKQKITLILIGISLAAYVVFPILSTLFPAVSMLAFISKNLDTGLISGVMIVFAMLFKLSSEKEALSYVPWTTITLICGVGMLIAVATSAGTVDALATWLGANVTRTSAPILMALIAGTMSFFSSTLGVVAPTLASLLPGMTGTSGLSTTMLYSVLLIASHFTGFSPLSSGGAMAMSGVADEKEKNTLFLQLMLLAAASLVLAIVLALTGIIR